MESRKTTIIALLVSCCVLLVVALAVFKWHSYQQDYFAQIEVSKLGGTYTRQSAALLRDTGLLPSSISRTIANPITEVDLSITSWPREKATIPSVTDSDIKGIASLNHLQRLSMLNRLGMLLVIGSLLTGFGSTGALGDDPDDVIKKELKAMAGIWKAVSIETDGKKAPDDILIKVVMTRDESGKTVIRRGDMVVLESMVKKLNPSKNPKTIDTEQTVGEHKGKTIQGIYEFDGDTFRVCLAPPGKERPSEFSAKAGSGNSLAVYKREKK